MKMQRSRSGSVSPARYMHPSSWQYLGPNGMVQNKREHHDRVKFSTTATENRATANEPPGHMLAMLRECCHVRCLLRQMWLRRPTRQVRATVRCTRVRGHMSATTEQGGAGCQCKGKEILVSHAACSIIEAV